MTRNPVGDREDFSGTYWSAILNAHAKEAVVSGCNPSKGAGDFDVDIASGEVVVGGTQVSVSSTTVSLSTSNSSDRVDIIHVDSSGTVSSTEGTASSTPTAPDIPADEVLLATVLVEGGASDLNSAGSKIADYRTIYVGGRAAKTVSSATTTSDEEVIGVDVSSSAQTITLATADAYLGKEIVIFDIADNASSNTITIDTEGTETIDPGGASSKTITVDGGFIRLYSDGTNWYAEGRAIDAETINTDELFTAPAGARLTKSSNQSITASNGIVEVDWGNATERNANADAFADTANNALTIPTDEYSVARVTVSIRLVNETELNALRFRKNGGGFTGAGEINLTNLSSFIFMPVQSDWVSVSSGDSFTAEIDLATDDTIDSNDNQTWFSIEAY